MEKCEFDEVLDCLVGKTSSSEKRKDNPMRRVDAGAPPYQEKQRSSDRTV